jgi:hypothetical protein
MMAMPTSSQAPPLDEEAAPFKKTHETLGKNKDGAIRNVTDRGR